MNEVNMGTNFNEVNKAEMLKSCAVSLFNISMDLKKVDSSASDVCLTLAKSILKNVDFEKLPKLQHHTEKTSHNSNYEKEVEEIAKKIRESL